MFRMNMFDTLRQSVRIVPVIVLLAGLHAQPSFGAGDSTSLEWDSARIAKVNQLAQIGSSYAPAPDSVRSSAAKVLRRPQDSLGGLLVKVTLALALVIALLFGISWAARRFGLVGGSKLGGGGSMDLLETLPLGQNRGLLLIRVVDKVYLIGQTAETIVNLEVFENEKALEIISASKGGSTMVQFKDAFNNFVSRVKKP